MDLSNKSLGNPNSVPEVCPVCGKKMNRLGWEQWGNMVYCHACRHSFENSVKVFNFNDVK